MLALMTVSLNLLEELTQLEKKQFVQNKLHQKDKANYVSTEQ